MFRRGLFEAQAPCLCSYMLNICTFNGTSEVLKECYWMCRAALEDVHISTLFDSNSSLTAPFGLKRENPCCQVAHSTANPTSR